MATPLYTLSGSMAVPLWSVALLSFLVPLRSRVTVWASPKVGQKPLGDAWMMARVSRSSFPVMSKELTVLEKGNMLQKCCSWSTPGTQVDRNPPELVMTKSDCGTAACMRLVMRLPRSLSRSVTFCSSTSLLTSGTRYGPISGSHLLSKMLRRSACFSTSLPWNFQGTSLPATASCASLWQLQVRVFSKTRSQTGTGPSISASQILRLQKWRQSTLKQQPPLVVPITGTPRTKWWENLWRWPWTTPSTVPTGRESSSAEISSLAHWLSCSLYLSHSPQVLSALQSLPTWLTSSTAFAPRCLSRALRSITTGAYSRNWQGGKDPSLKAPVVEGVSSVDSPITPILMPDFSSNICSPLCSGRKSSSPFSERRLAARLTDRLSLPAMQGRRKEGPKSNSWLPMAEASTPMMLQKSFMICPLLTSEEAYIPP